MAIGSAYLLEHHDVRTSPGNKLEVRLCSPILLSHPPKVALSVLAHPGILIKAVAKIALQEATSEVNA